jgi:hypothetical protein
VIFQGLDADNTRQEFGIVRRWWYEPSEKPGLDTTLAELDAYPHNVDPLPLARQLPALKTEVTRAYVVGHPKGLTQPQFSLHDNALLDYEAGDVALEFPESTRRGEGVGGAVLEVVARCSR